MCKVKVMIQKALDLEIELVWLPIVVKNQTGDEFMKGVSEHDNNRGLNKQDAPLVTAIYKKVLDGGHLSGRDADFLRAVLPKYHKQYESLMESTERCK